MLWTDQLPVSVADLLPYDADLFPTIAAEQLDAEACVQRAYQRCSQELETLLMSGLLPGIMGFPTAHIETVLHTGLPSTYRVRRLGQVVVNNTLVPLFRSPLESWLIYSAIAVIYQTALSKKPTDDRKAKLALYDQEAKIAWNLAKSQGIPALQLPMPAPAARYEPMSGKWTVSAVSGGSQPAMKIRVALTFTDADFQGAVDHRNNGESGPSEWQFLQLADNQRLRVDISGLRRPTGGRFVSDRVWLPERTATGWMIYVAIGDSEEFVSQTVSPLPFSDEVTLTTITSVGLPMRSGQTPDYHLVVPTGGGMVFRG